jgi:hypothetical protein
MSMSLARIDPSEASLRMRHRQPRPVFCCGVTTRPVANRYSGPSPRLTSRVERYRVCRRRYACAAAHVPYPPGVVDQPADRPRSLASSVRIDAALLC